MKKLLYTGIIGSMLALAASCSKDDKNSSDTDDGPITTETFISASDMSSLPEAEQAGMVYHNANGIAEDALVTLAHAGCNAVRIRLWKNPANGHSGFAEVKALADRAKALNMKVWLTVHFSDTWADPGQQAKPQEWEGLSFDQLKAAVQQYTTEIINGIHPDIFQIGNETNNGFLYPEGRLSTNEAQYLQLVNAVSSTIRATAPDTKIMLHFAGIENAEWFFSKTANVDYDYIGLSYYPLWHGKNLTTLKNLMTLLGETYDKDVLIAETAYPFTLGYNDYTNNIVGQTDQLVSGYPATPEGQEDFLFAIRNIVKTSGTGIGFAYWGGEWVAFKGPEATNGSSFENQALWDFDGNAVPAINAFVQELE